MAAKKRKVKNVKKVKIDLMNNEEIRNIYQSIIGIGILFLAVLIGVGLFMTAETGPFGIFIKDLLLGIFGGAGYILPVLIFYIGWEILVQKDKQFIKRRGIGLLILCALISGFLSLASFKEIYNSDYEFTRNVGNFFSYGKDLIGGGVIGGLLVVPIIIVFGNLGAWLIMIAAFVGFLIMVTGIHIRKAGEKLSAAGAVIEGMFSKLLGVMRVGDDEHPKKAKLVKKEDKKKKVFDIDTWDEFFEKMASDIVDQDDPDLEPIKAVARMVKDEDNQEVNPSANRKSKNVAEELKLEHNMLGMQGEDYIFPPIDILTRAEKEDRVLPKKEAKETAIKLEETLKSFGVVAKVLNVSKGPTVTRYELSPGPGVKVSKIVSLADDLALNLAAPAVRIEAPIPGKAAIGIEIPNKEQASVFLREIIETKEFKGYPSNLGFAIGKDIGGRIIVADIAKMPHLLIAGATGAGKSVCINTIITSILYKSRPDQVKMLMIDPKVVELGVYNGIPHLLVPVVTDPKKAAGALNWAVQEMISRYNMFAEKGVRDIKGYNAVMIEEGTNALLPQILIIIDELADLMMVAPNDVEDAICRLAQMARAAGMHLIIATQRPSVDVITGVIKANIPSRVSFAVSSQVDSRTILDSAGAEKLLGKGDMLYHPVGQPKPIRLQGTLVTDKEVEAIVEFVKAQGQTAYDENIIEKLEAEVTYGEPDPGDNDVLLPQAADLVIDMGQASISVIQRRFKVGYARAARLVDQLEARGIIGGFEGSKPRKILISRQQWEDMKEE